MWLHIETISASLKKDSNIKFVGLKHHWILSCLTKIKLKYQTMNCRIPSGLWCFDKHQFSNLSCLIFDKGFMKLLRCLLLWRVNSMSFDGSWKIKTFLVWTFESNRNMAHCSGVIVHESYFLKNISFLCQNKWNKSIDEHEM